MMIRVGVIGTSWWTDAMYLPALQEHPHAEVVAVCGRSPERTRQFAQRWRVAQHYTDYRDLLASAKIDALIVASGTDSHYPITMAALDAGLHVLCEKPLALNGAQARAMARRAREASVTTMVPFTYRYMPTNRYIKHLIDTGYIGRPYHLNMRYYTGYGRGGDYKWRFDAGLAGAGVLGDLGTHWLHLARWYFGEITGISCYTDALIERPNRPDGGDYTRLEDSALMTVRFKNGAYGSLQVTTLAWEGTPFGQTHHMEFHGAAGTLYNTIDWDTVQEVRGLKAGEFDGAKALPVPDDFWAGARRDTVHNTYRDIFRRQENMTRAFITAAAEKRPIEPDFAEGARVQAIIDAALQSARSHCCWVEV